MALGKEYKKMSVHLYFIFPTQHKHVLRKKKTIFVLYYSKMLFYHVRFSRSAKSNSFLSFGQHMQGCLEGILGCLC